MCSQKIFMILLFSVTLNFEFNNGYKILGIFPFPGKSHFVMFEQIMRELARKGHKVDVISHFPLEIPQENYRDFSIKGTAPETQNNVTFQMIENISQFFWIRDFLQEEMNALCDILGHSVLQDFIKGPLKKTSYDLIVVEIFMNPCFLAFGHHFKIPIIGVTSSSLYEWMNEPFGNPLSTSLIHQSKNDSFIVNFFKRLINTASTIHAKLMFDHYSQEQNNYVRKYFNDENFPNINQLEKSVALVLVNSHYSLTGVKPLTTSIVEVGGIHIQEDEEKLPDDIQKWLDNSNNGCIYISFGSMVLFETFPRHLIEAFYEAFQNLPQFRFLIKIKKPDDLKLKLPSNVKTFSWLSQSLVFKYKNMKIFITHGGMMGGLESILNGIPMIGIPLFADQLSNLENLVQRKIAISLDWKTLNGEQLINAITEIFQNSVYRKNVNKLSKLYKDRPLSPLETATFWIEYIGRNGNVLQSPATKLQWWQLELLDVYGFLLLITFAISYTVYFIVVKLFKFFIFITFTKNLESKKKQ
ncbi:UDP-glucosyltransferase 2-like isoform X1 [Leptopilina heterotoma]|uniref:UDP-glucosyltransferase 2-like isoform X1 n=1 Tax=Leptopilina heterotoma TaxID=63436 RepID=UPI001CA802A9|nr:UDP-glucosyltransferase 2-like isoform X1 [Leptopilina heterotoma]